MTGKTAGRTENKQILQQVSPVTSKCLGMVFSTLVDAKPVNGKEIFDDFQLRNSTCYWNSALSESIRNLQYLGFLEPRTILLGGNDVCLENLRMAWGRRVLNDPHNCRIEKIGDIGHIMMQEVPQNHFIPLPEILCLIILDLNNKQILATVDIIQAQLKKCYQGTQLPSNQLVYETLHSLIQERKIFHTGSGYFVVTPDTLRLPVDLPSPRLPLQHNPMYLPVSSQMTFPDQNQNFPVNSNTSSPVTTVAMTQTLPPVRSISCQVTGSLANQKRASTPELKLQENEKPRLNRSHSARRYKDKEKSHKVEEPMKKNVSIHAKDDCLTSRDVNIMKSNLNKVKEKGEKKSLLSKLFGKKKKVEEATRVPVKVTKPDVEYATFSAQFPPPEWKWYQEQCKKQERTKDWVTQQTGRPVMSHGSHKTHRHMPEKRQELVQTNSPVTLPTVASSGSNHKSRKHRTSEKLHTYHEIESYTPCNRTKPQCVQAPQEVKFKPIQNPYDKDIENRFRRTKSHHKKTNRHSMDVDLFRKQHIQREQQQQQQNMALSPMYSSTPRDCDRICSKLGAVENVNVCSSPIFHQVDHDRTNREHRSRKRRSKHYKRIDNDISCEYVGRLPYKHSNIAMSRDSGVNCVGLSNPPENNNVFCYNQFMDDEHHKSTSLRKSMEKNTLHQSESHKNEIVCVAEINTCVQQHDSIMDTDRMVQNQSSPAEIDYQVVEKTSDLSKSECIDSSEQSYDTVIYNKRLQDVSRETENMTLGDSGFHSPRIAELELDKNKNKMKVPIYKNLIYDHNELNNMKDMQKEKIVLNNEFYKEPSPSSDYQVVGVV